MQPRLLDSGSIKNNILVTVMRIFLFGLRERRSPVVGVGRVPSLGPHHREEREATTMGRGET